MTETSADSSACSVALLIPALTAGGAERVISGMANFWAQAGWTVHLLTLAPLDAKPFYWIDPRVRLVNLGVQKDSHSLFQKILNNLARLAVVRKAIVATKADVVISFIDQMNILTLASMIGRPTPIIVSERIYPGFLPLPRAWKRLRTLLYPRAFAVINQTQRGHDWFCPAIQAVGRIIPNHVELYPPTPTLYRHPTVVGTGRLTDQKDFATLIRAFAQVAPRYPEWRLTIWGEGPERGSLEQLVQDLRLQDRVSLPGVTSTAGQWLHGATLFVLSSKAEGFPNVLLEAMYAGLPVISTDCPAGPGELIEDNVSGLLVPVGAVGQMAQALDEMMGNSHKRTELGQRAAQTAQAYLPDRIMAAWTDLVRQAKATKQ